MGSRRRRAARVQPRRSRRREGRTRTDRDGRGGRPTEFVDVGIPIVCRSGERMMVLLPRRVRSGRDADGDDRARRRSEGVIEDRVA